MSWDRLVRVAAPAAAPLSRDAAKLHLSVDASDQDSLIDDAIAAAVAEIDGPRGLGICMVDQTWRLSLDSFNHRFAAPGDCRAFNPQRNGRHPQGIDLLLGPVIEVVSVKYVAADGTLTTLDPAAYQVDTDQDPAVLTPVFNTFWPITRRQPGAVKIEFRAGFALADSLTDVPADLVRALKLLVGHAFLNREAVVGAEARVTPIDLPRGVDAVFDRYRALGIA